MPCLHFAVDGHGEPFHTRGRYAYKTFVHSVGRGAVAVVGDGAGVRRRRAGGGGRRSGDANLHDADARRGVRARVVQQPGGDFHGEQSQRHHRVHRHHLPADARAGADHGAGGHRSRHHRAGGVLGSAARRSRNSGTGQQLPERGGDRQLRLLAGGGRFLRGRGLRRAVLARADPALRQYDAAGAGRPGPGRGGGHSRLPRPDRQDRLARHRQRGPQHHRLLAAQREERQRRVLVHAVAVGMGRRAGGRRQQRHPGYRRVPAGGWSSTPG